MLEKYYNESEYDYEICIDEVGRGCLFGDVVVASSILPKPCDFPCENIKDSKKFTSKIKLARESEHIKANVLYYHIASISPAVIDEINTVLFLVSAILSTVSVLEDLFDIFPTASITYK